MIFISQSVVKLALSKYILTIWGNYGCLAVVNVYICQVRDNEISAHRFTPSDVDDRPCWLILINQRDVRMRASYQCGSRLLPSTQVKCS